MLASTKAVLLKLWGGNNWWGMDDQGKNKEMNERKFCKELKQEFVDVVLTFISLKSTSTTSSTWFEKLSRFLLATFLILND